ncbi:hypothetical protein [Spongiimicrobium salis]|uniref:hypothetical protein n=1 Tax=Spongiimicrobium salis TaxID=1667022 RepID=UPI00374DF9C0
MKKHYVFFFLCLNCFLWGIAQNSGGQPATIRANDHITVSVFFPSVIAKVIPPAVNYKFDYAPGEAIGTLKARKGTPSNLTVITDKGNIYSFILEYSEKVENFNFILSEGDAVGKTVPPKQTNTLDTAAKPIQEDTSKKEISENKDTKLNSGSTTETKPDSSVGEEGAIKEDALPENPVSNQNQEENDLYDEDKEEYYRIFCENNYLQRTIIRRNFRQNKRIVLKLNNILVDREEIYFILQIENNSKREYYVNGLGFFLDTNTAEVPKLMTPEYKFNLQEIIDPESVNELVYVFKRFRLKNKEEINIVLDELNGNRSVSLPLTDKQVNSPTN